MRSFEAFSSHDFEHFMADLLGSDEERRYEVFARGPDQGVDLRHVAGAGEVADIVQCKRYVRSSYSDLKKAAKHEAFTLAVAGTRPRSYRFVTTLPLTPANKRELAEILSAYVSGAGDIIGADDLETLLDANEDVERRHPKLWLSGGVQLDAVLHGGTYQRSRQLLEETRAALPRYVETRAFFTARERLREERVLVIAGSPGIGKTTLARMLLVDAALDGFDPIEISADAEEANHVFGPERRQAFYYDDFLGTTFLQDRLAKNEDKRIAQLIRRVVASKTALFVMTTREHILNQALQFYEELEREGIDARRYLLELSDYTRLDRARIFYNHIWSSGQLDQGAREELLAERAYERILDHPHYNPRLIEHITGLGSHRLSDGDREGYLDFALGILDDPSQIWRHAFERQLDEAQRGMLVVLVAMQSKVIVDDLRNAFRAYCEVAGIERRGTLFTSTLKILDDSFLSTHLDEGETFVEPINPSVNDFIASWLAESIDEAVYAVEGASYFAQLEWLLRSVVPALATLERELLLTKLAEALPRLLDSEEPRWGPVHMGGRGGSVRTIRLWVESAQRLIFLDRALHDYPSLDARVGSFLQSRLLAEIGSWEGGHVINNATPVALVAALQSTGRPTRDVAIAAKAYLLENLGAIYDWEQLQRLRGIEPSLFPSEGDAALRARFAELAAEMAASGYDELEDVDDLLQIESVARELGVDLAQGDFERAHHEVERYVQSREEQSKAADDEKRLASTYAHGENEAGQVDAVFARLALPECD
jgi:hypothetical protein